MNEFAKKYWESYWLEKNQPAPTLVSAWQFGANPNHLAQLVIDGTKTATCSAHIAYEIENVPVPVVGEYSIILDSEDKPLAMIVITSVEIVPFNEVSEAFAIAEGEGDLTYDYWWNVHVKFFTDHCAELGIPFSENMNVVCERFELIDVVTAG
ncbi:MAG: ASCH domain-containing protein [Bacilli bacterium]